jgi:hypothetical protein
MIQEIKDFFTNPAHIKLIVAFVVIYIGTVFPAQAELCNLIAAYLGVNIVVSGAIADAKLRACGK